MSSFWSHFREFDSYSKPQEDFRIKTITGGAVTLIAAIVILALFVSEIHAYMVVEIVEQLFVDSTTSDERVPINFDIVLHKLPCSLVTVDLMDVSSDNQDNIEDDIYKIRLDASGRTITEEAPSKIEVNQNKTLDEGAASTSTKCGSCYGALPDGACCNTCEEVKEAYQIKGWQVDLESVEQCKNDNWVQALQKHQGEGCRVYGKVQVAKVAGNFHIAPGDPFRTMRAHGAMMYQYYVKVVPTAYHFLNGTATLNSHQFSVTTHMKAIGNGVSGLPGVFVQYEFSPLMVMYKERAQSFTTFAVNLCAIVGGVYTVASLVDAFIYTGHRVLREKMQLNKLG